jgi:hypothetical protein
MVTSTLIPVFDKIYDKEQADIYYRVTSGIPISEGGKRYGLQETFAENRKPDNTFLDDQKEKEKKEKTLIMIVLGFISIILFSR